MLRWWNDREGQKRGRVVVCASPCGDSLFQEDRGSALVELALILPLLLLLIAGTVDFGWFIYSSIEVSDAAQAGALYGTLNPTDVVGISNAAKADSAHLSSLSTTVSYGCECSDGSSAVPSCTAPPNCSYNYVNYVDVTASAPFTSIIPLPGLPLNGNLASEARMRVGGD
jgi:Flp pilus assembly protein TadG